MMRRERPAEVFGFVANVLDPHQVEQAETARLLGLNLIAVTPERAAELCEQNASSVSLEDISPAGHRVFCHRVSGYGI